MTKCASSRSQSTRGDARGDCCFRLIGIEVMNAKTVLPEALLSEATRI
jgi:hypothetical protein